MARRVKKAKPKEPTGLDNIFRLLSSDRIFVMMAIAEQAIAEQAIANADLQDDKQVFLLLQPPEGMLAVADEVYESHCRELCQRWNCGEDMRPATTAEVLMAVCNTSLQVPLNRCGAVLYEHCFATVFGVQALRKLVGEPAREEYDGQKLEALNDARNRLRQETRRREK